MPNRVIGLDIGASTIKAAQVLRRADGTFVVEKRGLAATPAGAVSDGQVDERGRMRLAQALAGLVADAGFDTRLVVLGLHSSAAVFLSEMTLPWVSEADARVSMPNLIEHHNPNMNRDASELAWTITGVAPGPEPKMNVLVYSVRTEYARDLAAVVESAGLEVVGADLSALASLRATAVQPRPARQLDAIVDLGGDLITVLVHHGGVPTMMFLDPETGGDAVTARIADAMRLDNADLAQAEQAKRTDTAPVGLVVQARNEVASVQAKRIAGAIAGHLSASLNHDTLAGLTLIGGAARLTGLGNFLHAELAGAGLGNVPLTYARSDDRLTTEDGERVDHLDRTGSDYLVAMGLGMGATL